VKFNRKVAMAGTGVALMLASVGVVGTGAAFAKGKAASPGTVTCTSVKGVLKFSTPISSTGPTSGSQTTAFKGVISGCTASGAGAVTPKVGKVSSSSTSNGGSNCAGFGGSVATTATTFTIKWAPSTILPTVITFPAGAISVASGGKGFTLGGSGVSVAAGSSYAGTDNGGSSTASATTTIDLTNLCAAVVKKPLKSIKIVSGSDHVG